MLTKNFALTNVICFFLNYFDVWFQKTFFTIHLSKKYTNTKFYQRLMKFMMKTNLFNWTIQRSFFRQLIRYLRLKTEIFDCIQLIKFIAQRAKEIRENVLKNLKSNIKIFIACDIWTNSNKLIFLKMIAYFIDKNWRYRKILFAFQFLQKRHDENKLTNVILKIFMKYKFENRLMIVTTKNIFNNRILRQCLCQKLQNHEIEWNHKQKNFNCMTHVLQLTVTIILTNLNVQIRNDNIAFKFDVENFQQINLFFLKNIVRKINIQCCVWIFFLI